MNLANFLIIFINKLYSVAYVIVIIRIILSWIPMANNNFTRVIYILSEPMLAPFRKLFPRMTIDFSPILFFLVLGLVRNALVKLIIRLFA